MDPIQIHQKPGFVKLPTLGYPFRIAGDLPIRWSQTLLARWAKAVTSYKGEIKPFIGGKISPVTHYFQPFIWGFNLHLIITDRFGAHFVEGLEGF